MSLDHLDRLEIGKSLILFAGPGGPSGPSKMKAEEKDDQKWWKIIPDLPGAHQGAWFVNVVFTWTTWTTWAGPLKSTF